MSAEHGRLGESRKKLTLSDVAVEAGVSVATASRILSGRGEFSKSTVTRVLNAASELGYTKLSEARGRPRTRDSQLIEFVLGSFDDSWTDAVTAGARDAAFELGYDLVLTIERDDPDDDWPARVSARRPSGVILGIIHPTHRQLEQVAGLQIPLVLVEPRTDSPDRLPTVGTTDWQGGYDAGVHLGESSAERFLVVSGSPPFRFGRAREEGFVSALAKLRPDTLVERVESPWTDAPITEELLSALRKPGRVGVFACNDEMASAVYRAARRLQRPIPDEVSVVGFNDEPRSASWRPPLTTVRQPVREIGARAVREVHRLRAGGSPEDSRIELPSTLIVRGST